MAHTALEYTSSCQRDRDALVVLAAEACNDVTERDDSWSKQGGHRPQWAVLQCAYLCAVCLCVCVKLTQQFSRRTGFLAVVQPKLTHNDLWPLASKTNMHDNYSMRCWRWCKWEILTLTHSWTSNWNQQMWRTFGGSCKPRPGLFALKIWSVYCEYDAFLFFQGCFILLPFLGTAETTHFPIFSVIQTFTQECTR